MAEQNQTRYQFYYQFSNNFADAIGTRANGEVHRLHGVIINKLCNCKQGVEVRIHSNNVNETESSPKIEMPYS